MTRTFLLFLCLSISVFSRAQTPKNSTIKGTAIDSVKNEPLSYVTVSLQDVKTSQPVKSTLTKDDGTFEITAVAGDYKVVLAAMGYKNKTVVINHTGDLGRILLSPSSMQLNEVAVTGSRPIIKQEVDRISYDVQTDPENKVLTVLDMLRKVPMVSVDATDNIKLKGTGNYKILINGKESSLVAKNPSDVFKSMPASNIQRIEVITTPPAKYDAEGLAGIINVITKKNMDQGYNGSINTRYNTVNGPGINLNATLKQGPIGFSGYVGYNTQNKQTTTYGNSNYIIRPVVSTLIQEGSNTFDGDNLYSSAELSYELDSLNLLTGSFQQYKGNNQQGNDLYSNELNGDNSPARYYRSTNNGTSNYKGYDMGLNYQLGFKRNSEQLLTASYKYNLSSNGQNNSTQYLENVDYNHPAARAYDFKQDNRSGTREQTIQLDYVQPFKQMNIEAGVKGILRNSYSDFENYRETDDGEEFALDPLQTNSLDYHQNVYSAYTSYQLKLKKWVMKSGLRLEHTSVKANFNTTGSLLNQDYDNLMPSVSIQRTLNETNNLTFGFTNRVQRPGIWQLNPFVDRSNPKFIRVGNPDLQPVVNHTFELNYSNFKKGSLTVGLNYAFAGNTVENVLSVSPDTITTTTYQNVGKNKRLGLDINSNYPITSKLSVNINAELVHVWLSGTYSGRFYDNKGIQGHIFTYTSYKLGETVNLGFNIGYDSRYVLLQGKDNEYYFYSLSASKDILKKKATVSISANNPFEKYRKVDFYSSSPDFSQSNYNRNYARRINLSFNYKFGKLNSEIKKNKRGISNDDVSGGRGQ